MRINRYVVEAYMCNPPRPRAIHKIIDNTPKFEHSLFLKDTITMDQADILCRALNAAIKEDL